MTKKVSILLPSYNYEKYIKTAINSVLKQTYTNWELIVIDDGSSDNSVNIIKLYTKDKRIRLYTQTNQGVTKTLNKAFKLAKGDYICFLDADDLYHPKKLEKQVQMLEKGYDLVTTKVSAVDADGKASNDKFFNLWWNTFDPEKIFGPDIEFKFFNGNYLCKSAVMLKKELFEQYGMFNTKLITAYDLELWIKMLPHIKIGRCNNILTYYRWHGLNETTTNTLRMRAEILLVYDKYIDSLRKTLKENCIKIKNYIVGFSLVFQKNGLYNAYIGLQILKQTIPQNYDIYNIISDEKYYNIIKTLIEGKNVNYDIIKDGEGKKIKAIKSETLWERIRRRIIPLKIRKKLRKLIRNKRSN